MPRDLGIIALNIAYGTDWSAPVTPRPPSSSSPTATSESNRAAMGGESRKYIDLCGWDPVLRSMVDFKLDADSVSDATVIRRYSCGDVREEVQCVEVTVYPAGDKIGRGAVAARRFILAVLSPGVKDLGLRDLENAISNLSAILPFLPAAVNPAFGVHWKIKARLDELKEEVKLQVRAEMERQREATLTR